MKKLLLLAILFLCTQTNIKAQSWKYENGGSNFDGKYKTSFVKGSGSKFPYNDPILAINKYDKNSTSNFFISSAGYFQEGTGVKILWVFNTEPDIIYSTYSWSYSSDGKTLFFEKFNDPNSDNKISKYEFMEKLKSDSRVSVRISNKFGTNDLVFSLSGSTKAIDFVLPNLNNLISDAKSKRKIKNDFKEVKKIELNRLLEILKNQKISESSMSILKNQIETDLGIGLLGLEGTGETYTSIKLTPYKQEGMFESYGYVNIFYVLEDGTEKEIYGSFKVDMDSPFFNQINEEKLIKKRQLEEERLIKERQLEEERLILEEERLNKERLIEDEKVRLKKILSKYQNPSLIESMIKKIQSEQRLTSVPKWQLSKVKDVKAVFSNFEYGKIWDIKLKIIFSEFTDVEKKFNSQIVKDGFVMTGNIYPSGLGITKKDLRKMGGKLNVEF